MYRFLFRQFDQNNKMNSHKASQLRNVRQSVSSSKRVLRRVKIVFLALIVLLPLTLPRPIQGKATIINLADPPIVPSTLVNVIDTSLWSPPSPDPTGLVHWVPSNTLLVADSEVDEMPPYFTGSNMFQSSLNGSLIQALSVMDYTPEPDGIAVNPINNHLFIADDDQEKIFEFDVGLDNKLGTSDDIVTSFSTSAFGSMSPHGIAFGDGELFISDVMKSKIYKVNPGSNRIFDGVPPSGDDSVDDFDTIPFGVKQPSAIEFNYLNQTLFIIGDPTDFIAETTKSGVVLRLINIEALNILLPSGMSLGKSSQGSPTQLSLFIADRGLDNDFYPEENDGKIFEITVADFSLLGIYLPFIPHHKN
jgi:hypothetical protein